MSHIGVKFVEDLWIVGCAHTQGTSGERNPSSARRSMEGPTLAWRDGLELNNFKTSEVLDSDIRSVSIT